MDMFELVGLVQKVKMEAVPVQLGDLSPWERGVLRERLSVIVQVVEAIGWSTYNGDGTFTEHGPVDQPLP